MVKYIIKRLLIGLLTLFVLVTITFFLTRLMPGNPFESENIQASTMEALIKQYGLDKPLFTQYITYIENLFHGDLGVSFKKPGVTVNNLIATGAPATMSVGLIAFFVSTFIGIGLGIWQAMTKSEVVKSVLITGATVGISLPNFIIALLLMMLFGVALKALPIIGLSSPKHYILPVISQTVYPIAVISRMVKTSFSEAMRQDFVTMAKAKGLKSRTVFLKHVLKNALIPVVTILGPMIAFLLTGSFVVENLYSIPGIGMQFVNSISNRDYTVIMGLSIFIGAVVIVCNLIVDILCSIIDPRIKISD